MTAFWFGYLLTAKLSACELSSRLVLSIQFAAGADCVIAACCEQPILWRMGLLSFADVLAADGADEWQAAIATAQATVQCTGWQNACAAVAIYSWLQMVGCECNHKLIVVS